MNNKFINSLASIQGKYPRSRFNFPFNHKTSFDLGRLYPLSVTEVLPGDTITMDVHSLTRMATPIAPIMDNIKQDIWFFFVPRRLVDDNFSEVITYADWDGINQAELETFASDYQDYYENFKMDRKGIGHYLGLPIGAYAPENLNKITTAAFKSYVLIWNTYFRDENYQSEIIPSTDPILKEYQTPHYNNNIYKPGTGESELMGESLLPLHGRYTLNDLALPVNEFHDLYTSVLPAPQKGPSVSIPLTGNAPVIGAEDFHDVYHYNIESVSGSTGSLYSINGAVVIDNSVNPNYAELNDIVRSNLVADLSNASTSINQLRSAILTQHFLEQLARTGGDSTRLQEYYLGFWGVVCPDARLQMPEFIASHRFNINVSEVLQTAGYNEANDTTLGTTGAVSRTGSSSKGLFTKSFSEHGYLIAVTAVRHDLSYSQGIPAHFEKKTAFDFYTPVFNGLGEQPVYTRRILAPLAEIGTNNDIIKDEYATAAQGATYDDILGYNEPWYEYRFRENRTSGMLNPVAKDGLDFWTLTKAFTSGFITGADIRISDKATLARALTTGTTTDQFIMDYFEDCKITRIMPVKSIPGIDKL